MCILNRTNFISNVVRIRRAVGHLIVQALFDKDRMQLWMSKRNIFNIKSNIFEKKRKEKKDVVQTHKKLSNSEEHWFVK